MHRPELPDCIKTMSFVALVLSVVAVFAMASAHAQSLGATNPSAIGRDFRNLDQIYAVAPSVITGQYPMTQAQFAITGLNNASLPQLSTTAFGISNNQSDEAIIESISEPNWIWVATTTATAAAGAFVYLLTRPE